MSRPPILVIADDLTGAAEIAAIGHRHGLRSSVVSEARAPAGDAELLVFDTDSRLDDARVATGKISALAKTFATLPHGLVYKKTDSVLRGPVRAELEALARSLGATRVLLVPANPALGRTVQSGSYAIRGVPLHETPFARDPHHPAKTSDVRQLLGENGTLPVNARAPDQPLPATGIVIGDALSGADLTAWARQVPPDAVLAGAGEFFSALLSERGFTQRTAATPFVTPDGPVLVISGTTHSAGADLRQSAARAGVPVVPMPTEILLGSTTALFNWTQNVRARLADGGRALAVFEGAVSDDPQTAVVIRKSFGKLARELIAHRVVRHLIVEGGATAAAVTRALGWPELRLVHEWAPGVASLRPVEDSAVTLTLKPGSYAWPSALWQNFAGSGTNSPHA